MTTNYIFFLDVSFLNGVFCLLATMHETNQNKLDKAYDAFRHIFILQQRRHRSRLIRFPLYFDTFEVTIMSGHFSTLTDIIKIEIIFKSTNCKMHLLN